MKVKDVRLYTVIRSFGVCVEDQNGQNVFIIYWGPKRTKPQAIAIAKRLCYRFNAGQEKP